MRGIYVISLLGVSLVSHASYSVKPGDTLSGLASKLYGNLEKWRPIFDLNRESIKDPNLIYVGQRIRLLDQDAELLPNEVLVASNTKHIQRPKSKKRSQEWRLLPKQAWERFVFREDPAIDPHGFDRRSKVSKNLIDQTRTTHTISTDRIPIAGEIVGARSEHDQLYLGEQVFIRADETLSVGKIYSLTSGPEKVSSTRDGRVGFVYPLSGKIRLIGVRDGLFIGTIVQTYGAIERHQLLIPEVANLKLTNAAPAPSAIVAEVILPKSPFEFVNQENIVFLDVGASDGVKPGMIFRNYLHEDPNNGELISARDFLIQSELKVLETSDQFSTAIILNVKSSLINHDEVIALTDLHDFDRNQGLQTTIQEASGASDVDTLDQLDSSDGLGEKEREELKQLENWSESTPSEGTLPQVNDSALDDEIKVEVLNPAKNASPNIGEESAPNDGSGLGESPPSNELPPETAPIPAETGPATGSTPLEEAPSTEATQESPPVDDIPPPPSE